MLAMHFFLCQEDKNWLIHTSVSEIVQLMSNFSFSLTSLFSHGSFCTSDTSYSNPCLSRQKNLHANLAEDLATKDAFCGCISSCLFHSIKNGI